MADVPIGQMTWKPEDGTDWISHLRHSPSQSWRFYKGSPEYVLPDPSDFSEGCATCMALFEEGWKT